eukprot:gene3564-4077_t
MKKAIYEVDDLQGALSNTAQTQLKEVFGNMNFTEALESQSQINEHLVQEFSKLFSAWGIIVERMELLDLSPKSTINEAMKKQMVAERRRRGDFIKSEGDKAAMNLKAEGEKVFLINMGIAEQESTRKKSEGQAEASIEIAQAESACLEVMSKVLGDEAVENSETNYRIALKYLDLISTPSIGVKNMYIPYKIEGLQSIINGYTKVYQGPTPSNKNSNTPAIKNVVTKRNTSDKKEFAELD